MTPIIVTVFYYPLKIGFDFNLFSFYKASILLPFIWFDSQMHLIESILILSDN